MCCFRGKGVHAMLVDEVVCMFHPLMWFLFLSQKIDSINHSNTSPMQNQTRNMQTPTTTQTTQTTQTVEYDFENDDDAFYDLIEFGIASNGGRLSIW